MITLRVKEIIDDRCLTLEALSNDSGVALKDIQAYITSPTIEVITDTIAEHLRKIAKQLNVPVIELVKPVAKQEAFRLKILKLAKDKDLTLTELSKLSGVNFAVLAFYSTQPISHQKLAETQCQKHLSDITKALNCRIEDLLVTADLPITKLCILQMIQDRGILLEEYSILLGINSDFINLLATQPVDIESLINIELEEPTVFLNIDQNQNISEFINKNDSLVNIQLEDIEIGIPLDLKDIVCEITKKGLWLCK